MIMDQGAVHPEHTLHLNAVHASHISVEGKFRRLILQPRKLCDNLTH